MKNKGTIILTTLLLAMVAVFIYYEINLQNNISLSATISLDGYEEQLICWEDQQGEWFFYLPAGASMNQVHLQIDSNNPLLIDGIQIHSGMSCEAWSVDIKYPLSYIYWGRKIEGNVTFVATSCATMHIDTESGSLVQIHGSRKHREQGVLRIYDADGKSVYEGSLEAFGGRGNSSWESHEKKPYNLKLSADADLLGMGAAKKWILLANAADMTHIRNRFVYEFADDAGLAFTPQSQWVDLYINGEYRGLYLLCERNEIHDQRVDISAEQGVLVSMDSESKLMGESNPYVVTESGQAFELTNTAVVPERVLALLQSVENAIMAEDGIDPVTGKTWQDLIDIDSWARKYLVEELFGNMDAGCKSQYFYCDMSGTDHRLYAGPVWDYDLSIGTIWMMQYPQTLFADRLEVRKDVYTPWFYALCRKTDFSDYVAKVYVTEFQPLLERYLRIEVPEQLNQVSRSMYADWKRWSISEQDGMNECQIVQNYMAERSLFLKNYLLKEKEYCKVQVDSGTGVYYVTYLVEPGRSLEELDITVDNSSGTFQGWYYTDTGTPADMEAPIYQDLAISAKWKTPLLMLQIKPLLPLGVCALVLVIIFFRILWIEFRRI